MRYSPSRRPARSWHVLIEPGGPHHKISPHFALSDQPPAATKAMIPALALWPRQIAPHHPRWENLAAVAELVHFARTAIGTGEQKRHAVPPFAGWRAGR